VKVIVNYIPSVEGMSKIDVEMIIEDSGIGVHSKDREKIFEAFQQQCDLPQHYGGTGLGLSISRKLLQMMNGTVTVENSAEHGSRFIVYLKEVAIASVAPSEDVKEWTFTGEEEFKTPVTILVVDDIPSNREMIAALLTDSGLMVLEAQNGEAAVKCARDKKPSCIIMDILMPVMDGVQAAQILKKNSETARIPIIALTTMSRDSLACGRDLSMFDGTLGKPVTSHDLFEELGRHLPGVHEVSSQSLGKLFELLDNAESGTLPDVFQQKAFELLGAVKMDDVRDFAGNLITFATGNHRPNMKLIGKKLGEYADHFDITGVRKILRKIAGPMVETVENS
jgi:two-component system, sensor histidine kinase and response regulator